MPLVFVIISSRSLHIGRHQGIKAQFLDRYDKFCQFALIGLDHVRMHPSDLLKLVLKLRDQIALAILYLLNGFGYGTDSPAIDVGCLEDFIELQVLDFQLFAHGPYFFLKNEVVESLPLLDGVDGLVENFKTLLSFSFLVLV
jgi:hypothetical protein